VKLKILLPSLIYAEKDGVTRLVVETSQGSYGILPHRRDCIAVLVPGILTFETQTEGVAYAAVDVGVLVKIGADVHISVRRAVFGAQLGRLREMVQREYSVLDQTEREVRHVSEKLENGFLRRVVELHHERS
jgi:F-type H+-transporting ATPase subunit epsilon